MWFLNVGVTGTGENFDAEDISAAFSLMGLDFEVMVTVDDESTIGKQARRSCYQNKLHDRVKKIHGGLIDELSGKASLLVHFGNDLTADVHAALFSGIPVVLFPENFKEALTEGWKGNE